jgi:hypothetical protein
VSATEKHQPLTDADDLPLMLRINADRPSWPGAAQQLARTAANAIDADRQRIAALESRIAAVEKERDEARKMVVLCGNCGNRYVCDRDDSEATCPCKGQRAALLREGEAKGGTQ